MTMKAAGRALLEKTRASNADHALRLLTPGTPTRVWDETLDDYVEMPGEPVVRWEGLGSLQPWLKREDARVDKTAGVQEEQGTHRAYLPYTAFSGVDLRDVYLVDNDEASPTYNKSFALIKPPQAMGGKGVFRLELKVL